jgi:nucleoside-diphosphate kinase
MSNRTLTIIKPDSIRKRNFGKILSRLEAEGFTILGIRRIHLTQKQAEAFYAVHRERPFYRSLVQYMMSGPVVAAALERNDAVAHLRKVMGATDPKKADPGTIRSEFGESIEQNAIHGSDSDENARIETRFFFSDADLI